MFIAFSRSGRFRVMVASGPTTSSSTVRLGIRHNRPTSGMDVISHPDKVLFPHDGITKGDLADYYQAIASVMVPHVRGRPVTMERFPAGIGQKGFLQKDLSKGFPGWLQRVEAPKKGGVVHYP